MNFQKILKQFYRVSLFTLALYLSGSPSSFGNVAGNLGTDFWLTFPQGDLFQPPRLEELLISSATATSGTVQIPGLSFTTPFTIPAGGMTTVTLPIACMPTGSDVTAPLGIHITASALVAVIGLSYEAYSTDAYLALPTATLGQSYISLSYDQFIGDSSPPVTFFSELAVVGVQNGTAVTITPSVATGTHAAGVPFIVTLNQGDVYQLQNGVTDTDLSGSLINASNPVAIWGAVEGADVPVSYTTANYIVEQLWPTSMWGMNFITVPLATRLNGDTFRFLASQNGTNVSVNGALVATLGQGQYFEQILTIPSQITSNNPIYVMQYSNGEYYDNVPNGYGDPSMISIPPVNEFATNYLVPMPLSGLSPSGFAENFENIMVPTASVGTLTLDGTAIPAGLFTPVGTSGYSGAQVSVSVAPHALAGPVPFGVIVYGFDGADAYGYPGGLLLAMTTPTTTPTNTPTITPTPTPTPTPINTFTPTITVTPMNTFTNTPVCDIQIWPDPYSLQSSYGQALRISCLPAGAQVLIFTVSGELVNMISRSGDPTEWIGAKNRNGATISPGIYY